MMDPLLELNDVVLVEIARLITAYPEVNFDSLDCGWCGAKAVYMCCGKISKEPFADYEPNQEWAAVFFELRSTFGTNFEIPVCETHMYGMTE